MSRKIAQSWYTKNFLTISTISYKHYTFLWLQLQLMLLCCCFLRWHCRTNEDSKQFKQQIKHFRVFFFPSNNAPMYDCLGSQNYFLLFLFLFACIWNLIKRKKITTIVLDLFSLLNNVPICDCLGSQNYVLVFFCLLFLKFN